MANYFRITAYHPTENLSVIMDSNGLFEKLWQFSSFMVSKGFKIIEVGGEDKFDDGDMPKAEQDTVHVILRACKSGKPEIQGNRITVEGKSHNRQKPTQCGFTVSSNKAGKKFLLGFFHGKTFSARLCRKEKEPPVSDDSRFLYLIYPSILYERIDFLKERAFQNLFLVEQRAYSIRYDKRAEYGADNDTRNRAARKSFGVFGSYLAAGLDVALFVCKDCGQDRIFACGEGISRFFADYRFASVNAPDLELFAFGSFAHNYRHGIVLIHSTSRTGHTLYRTARDGHDIAEFDPAAVANTVVVLVDVFCDGQGDVDQSPFVVIGIFGGEDRLELLFARFAYRKSAVFPSPARGKSYVCKRVFYAGRKVLGRSIYGHCLVDCEHRRHIVNSIVVCIIACKLRGNGCSPAFT